MGTCTIRTPPEPDSWCRSSHIRFWLELAQLRGWTYRFFASLRMTKGKLRMTKGKLRMTVGAQNDRGGGRGLAVIAKQYRKPGHVSWFLQFYRGNVVDDGVGVGLVIKEVGAAGDGIAVGSKDAGLAVVLVVGVVVFAPDTVAIVVAEG